MLARYTCKLTSKPLSSISTICNKRNYFDYLRVANEYDGGKSLEQIQSEIIQEQQTAEATESFTWSWLNWFENNNPEKYADYASTRSQFQRWEQYLQERGITGGSKEIDFSDYRSRISDPSFVDNLEISYFVDRDCTSSIQSMNTFDQWNNNSIKSFKDDCNNNSDQLVAPLSSDDKLKQENDLKNAELYDEKIKILSSEMFKDFEQVDAERMMLGQDTKHMKLSEHPQYAETIEDIYAAKQQYLDFVMLPIHCDYVKRERLATMQDEERRKAFLERFEYASKVINGVDCSVPN